jgi:aryl-alcohol dehydrogenase-like predicted oxidoreductase
MKERGAMTRGLRNLGRSGLRVSPLCLGAMNFGQDEAGSIELVHAFLDAGQNFIDTANAYAGSEEIVGKAVKGRRDQVAIATKAAPMIPGPVGSGFSRGRLIRACEDSLRRLGMDYIDLYQLHAYDEDTPLEETLSALNDLIHQGKIRYIGVSNWTAAQIVEACLIARAEGWELPVSMQPQYNILTRDIELEILPTCRKFGLGVIPWGPLGGGMLTGKYKRGEEPAAGTRFATTGPFRNVYRTRSLSERNHAIVGVVEAEARQLNTSTLAVALAWILARPGLVAPIIGPKNAAQLKDNLAALDVELPPEAVARIDAASEPHLHYPHDFMRMARQLQQSAASRAA